MESMSTMSVVGFCDTGLNYPALTLDGEESVPAFVFDAEPESYVTQSGRGDTGRKRTRA